MPENVELSGVTVNSDAPAVKRLKKEDGSDIKTILANDTRTKKNKKLKPVNLLKKKPALHPDNQAETFAETEYEIDTKSGLRKVKPYYFTHNTFCRARWIKKSVHDVCREEFSLALGDGDNLKNQTNAGRMTVNLVAVDFESSKTTLMKDGDLLTNKVHRHEPPIRMELPEIAFEDDKYFVVSKPSSMPIHPVAQYRHNSLTFIMAREMKVNYYVVHRIDRLTSGIVIFAKTKEVSQDLTRQITKREVQKEYVCRVVGKFPKAETCDGALFCISSRKGIFRVAEETDDKSKVKDAFTEFERIFYDKKLNESVVRARPKTGRTHQIRVHLQYLGHPIKNDPVYNDPIFGPERFEKGAQKADLTEDELIKGFVKTRNWGENLYRKCDENKEVTYEVDELCDKCNEMPADPLAEDLLLYLHAHKYSGKDWKFESKIPEWGEKDYVTPSCYSKYN